MEILAASNPIGDDAIVDEIDIVFSLLNESPFKIRPDNEKLSLIQKGRPLPKLLIVKRDSTTNCNRTFQGSWYSIHKWLCGSKQYNKLFCWPCILMRPESSSWCSTGNDDMKRLSSMASKHSASKSHLKAITEYDATLVGFGLLPEFVNETRNENKSGHEPMDGSDSDDYFDLYFNDEQKSKKGETSTDGHIPKLKPNLTETGLTAEEKPNGSKPHISFKAWQEMCKHSHPFAKSITLEDKRLFKWRKKIARQKLRNAVLTGQKIKIEIELLKAKINHIKSLETSQKSPVNEPPLTMPLIVPVETIDPSSIGNTLE